MKTINLYFDFEFTSLSPDAQPISLGIVSDDIEMSVRIVSEDLLDKSLSVEELSKYIYDNKLGEEIKSNSPKMFYAEFSDFDINRCDDWVKENVVSKLKYTKDSGGIFHKLKNIEYGENYYYPEFECRGNTNEIKLWLRKWLLQFSDYQIQIVVDCGSKDWEWILNLMAEWDKKEEVVVNNIDQHKLQPFLNRIHKEMQILLDAKGREIIRFDYAATVPNTTVRISIINRIGLPKLPPNVSPVPFDLNDLIAIKNGITPLEAFELNREEIVYGKVAAESTDDKHNSLWDATVIKKIYNKLIKQ